MGTRLASLVVLGLLLLPVTALATDGARAHPIRPRADWEVLTSWFWVGRLIVLAVGLVGARLTLPSLSGGRQPSAENRWAGGWLWAVGTCGAALVLSVPQVLPGGSLLEVLFGRGVGTCALVLIPFVWFTGACLAGSVQVATGYDWRAVFEHPSLLDSRSDRGFFWGIGSGLIALVTMAAAAAVALLSISEWVADKRLVVYPAAAVGAGLCAVAGRAAVSRGPRAPVPAAVDWPGLLRSAGARPSRDAGGCADVAELARSEGPYPMCPRCLARAQFVDRRCENCGYEGPPPVPEMRAPIPPPPPEAAAGAEPDPAT